MRIGHGRAVLDGLLFNSLFLSLDVLFLVDDASDFLLHGFVGLSKVLGDGDQGCRFLDQTGLFFDGRFDLLYRLGFGLRFFEGFDGHSLFLGLSDRFLLNFWLLFLDLGLFFYFWFRHRSRFFV